MCHYDKFSSSWDHTPTTYYEASVMLEKVWRYLSQTLQRPECFAPRELVTEARHRILDHGIMEEYVSTYNDAR